MKKLLFVHDAEKIKEDESGNLYTDGSYPTTVWERYKSISKDITVMFRKERKIYCKEVASSKFNILDKSVKFIEIEDTTNSIKDFISVRNKKLNKNRIKKAVSECDVLIARVPSKYSYVAIDYATKYDKPYIVEVVGCAWDALWNYGLKGKLYALPSFFKQRKYVDKASYLVYVSNSFLQKRYPSSGKQVSCSNVILNQIDEVNLKHRIEKIDNSKLNRKLVVGTLGGIDVTFKGQQYMIKAMKQLKKIGINVEYQVAGAGIGNALLKLAQEEKVSDNFKIIGSIPHSKVYEWLQNIDIYIQPSNQEGLCRSIIEAMSCACPVIASNAGGNSELIDNKYIFKKKNVKQLVSMIKSMNNKLEMKEQAKKNFNISKDYDVKIINKRRESFFKDFIKNNNL